MHRLANLAIVAIAVLCLLPAPFPTAYIRGGEGANEPGKYRNAIRQLDRWIAEEVRLKDIPSLAIAMVDDQQVVWTKGFGYQDAAGKHPATDRTLYKVGSVSKPFTAILLMLLVEAGRVDLDAPVQTYLPALAPKNPYKKQVTLRQILSHHSGLVREPPVGNYFDDSRPTLAATVASMNKTELIYPPEKKYAYSNAGLAVVGRIIEKLHGRPFAQVMQSQLLDPIGMRESTFAPTARHRKHLAHALMWTWHGREFPAPEFPLGMAPAGSLHSNARDMARFFRFLFSGGKAGGKRLLRRTTLESMWKIQYPEKGKDHGFGLGFYVSKFEGKRRITHGGAVYGFSTQFAALPDDKLGVIVMASRDICNGLTRRIGDECLRHMLAVRAGKPLPKLAHTRPVPLAKARKLEGRYRHKDKTAELIATQGKLFYLPSWVGIRFEVREDEKGLIVDGRLGHGQRLEIKGSALVIDDDRYEKLPDRKPEPCPRKWRGLIGEYGFDYNTLYILEKDGKLHALIEWGFLYPLTEVSADVYRFPDFGLYHGDKLVFTRDSNGKATRVVAANVVFPRRPIQGEDGKLFTIEPTLPIDVLRKKALAAKPPREKGDFRKPDLVELTDLDKSIKLDIRYASKNNFLRTRFYTKAKAYMQRPAARALALAHRRLRAHGYGLWVFDAYRPWHVTKMFWDATPEKYRDFVADPAQGSRHNRGCAVDVTLYDLDTGRPVRMVAGFDEFTDRAYADYPGGTSLQRWHRKLLRKTLEREGFSVYPGEWWHFDYRDWRHYPILNLTFEEIEQRK